MYKLSIVLLIIFENQLQQLFVLKFTAIFLMAFMLISSIGISVDVHYCKDEFKSFAFFGEAKSCHETKAKSTCHHTKMASANEDAQNKDSNKKADCCHNDHHTFENLDLDAPNPELNSLSNFQLKFISIFFVTLSESFYANIVQKDFKAYKPPLFQDNILLLFQVFRI